MPGLQAAAVADLVRVLGPVQRERGRHQDRRVDARDQLRQLGALGRPSAPCHDPDEEVGREEGPEDHDLGDDEKQHPEQRGLDPRGAVGRRRPVVLVLVAGARAPARIAPASIRPPPASATRCARPACRSRFATRSTSLSATHFELSSGSVEMTISEMWKNCTAFITAVKGSGSPIMPAATMPVVLERGRAASSRRSRAARDRAARRRGPAGTTTMKRCGPSSASSLRRSTSSPPAAVWLATTSVTSNGRPSRVEVDDDVLDRQPGLLARARSRQVAPQPARRRRGQRGDDDLVDARARRSRPSRR